MSSAGRPRSPALYLPALILAFALSLIGTFKPHLAKPIAPFYAVAQGFVLGGLSAAYSQMRGGIVPTAVVATTAMFVGCYAVHKAGIVKVTRASCRSRPWRRSPSSSWSSPRSSACPSPCP